MGGFRHVGVSEGVSRGGSHLGGSEALGVLAEKRRRIAAVAAGRESADLVLKGGSYANVFTGEVIKADVAIADGVIAGLGSYRGEDEADVSGNIVVPGFIDPHIHLESAMATPSEFARAVVPHGTCAVVADPHEIVNVMGLDGLAFMMQATSGLPLDVYFTLPSCVPATPFDENGSDLDYRSAYDLLDDPRVLGLAEMMNYPGVVSGDAEVFERIAAALVRGLVVDGHAPGLRGRDLCAYVAAGVGSDHECAAAAEALEKLRSGMSVMIREGTAARNLDALVSLVEPRYADRVMFCCDDKHPSDLVAGGHIDVIVRRAISLGADPMLALRAATLNPAMYFGLRGRGAVACGYAADLAVVDALDSLDVLTVLKDGAVVFSRGELASYSEPCVDEQLLIRARDTFKLPSFSARDFRRDGSLGVIGVEAGEITTRDCGSACGVDTSCDVLKVAVAERHRGTGHVGVGYLKGYGLARGAIASSIAHDSHNVIVVGENDDDMALAVNQVVRSHGGIAVVERGNVCACIALPIAGLMSEAPLARVNDELERAKAEARRLGVREGVDPFMTLAFMSLTVIPEIRITTRGVFDVAAQRYR